MATILDVAKLAGVSQGTVSNVLNGKGNVSSEKIRIVEEAARKLGYTINEQARILRKGSGKIIGVILPTVESKQYREFYNSLKYYAERNGYSTELYISNNNPQTEQEMIQKAKSVMVCGMAVITCLNYKDNVYQHSGLNNVRFVERRPGFQADYYGFDYKLAGNHIARKILTKKYRNIVLVTESARFSNEAEFLKGFLEETDKEFHGNLLKVSTDIDQVSHSILNLFAGDEEIDVIVTTNIGFAEKIRPLMQSFFSEKQVDIHTLSPVVSLPEKDFKKYELNYSLLGREVASDIIHSESESSSLDHIFENDGERNWKNIDIQNDQADCLNILALDSPESIIMQGMAQFYTEKTGTKVKISVFSYDEIYEQFADPAMSSLYDIFRIDVTWLSWFAERLLLPLEEIDPDIKEVFSEYLPTLEDKYSYVRGKIYALPVSPSSQLLFYRKDLFESVVVKRIYQEKYRQELKVPETFEEFNQIAAFFTECSELDCDVRYGTNLTLGNTGVAATEFLARFFSHHDNLYNQDGKIVINNDLGKKALEELVEAQRYAPGKPSKWWTNTAKEFANGNVAMMINFSNYASEILGYSSKIVGNVGFGMIPGRNPIYGGGSLAVSRYSRHPQNALAFIKWLTREPVASAMAALGSVSPCIKTYNKYDIINTFPWLEFSKDCFPLSRTKRLPDSNLSPFDEKRFLNIIGTAVKNVMSGLLTTNEALERAQQMLDQDFRN